MEINEELEKAISGNTDDVKRRISFILWNLLSANAEKQFEVILNLLNSLKSELIVYMKPEEKEAITKLLNISTQEFNTFAVLKGKGQYISKLSDLGYNSMLNCEYKLREIATDRGLLLTTREEYKTYYRFRG